VSIFRSGETILTGPMETLVSPTTVWRQLPPHYLPAVSTARCHPPAAFSETAKP